VLLNTKKLSITKYTRTFFSRDKLFKFQSSILSENQRFNKAPSTIGQEEGPPHLAAGGVGDKFRTPYPCEL
jgi:hypothetical protein